MPFFAGRYEESYFSLCAVVEQDRQWDAKNGDAYVFINRSKSLAKVLWWDRTGWCLLLKRLTATRYRVSGKDKLLELEICGARMFFDGL